MTSTRFINWACAVGMRSLLVCRSHFPFVGLLAHVRCVTAATAAESRTQRIEEQSGNLYTRTFRISQMLQHAVRGKRAKLTFRTVRMRPSSRRGNFPPKSMLKIWQSLVYHSAAVPLVQTKRKVVNYGKGKASRCGDG